MNDIKKDLQYYRLIKQEIINRERSFDEYTLPRVERMIQALEKQLNGGWILVSERLPENQPSYIIGTNYIITRKQFRGVSFAKYKERKWIGDFGRIIADDEVLAWQPLPEPWKEVEN